MKLKPYLLLTCLLLASFTLGQSEENKSPVQKSAQIVKTPEDKAKASDLAKSYPLTTCVVSHDGLGGMGETVDALYEGRLIRFCCKGCVKSFNKNPDKYLKELDTAKKPAA
ncbi:hypothetical protein MCEMIH22_00218 [Candidatus Methylacidiphilaceae bacterium]|nr:hypothetical protein [Candidatus Paceibacterota bacterium]